jgi:hypothetical protein
MKYSHNFIKNQSKCSGNQPNCILKNDDLIEIKNHKNWKKIADTIILSIYGIIINNN